VKKLFVGGIPYRATDEELRELFSKAGTVETASIVIERDTGRSKGFGFVEMSSDEEAQNAVKMFDQTDFGGRNISVSIARPREERPQSFGGDRR